MDDDEQSFHQGPGAGADPSIVRWQVKMWLSGIVNRVSGEEEVEVDDERLCF